MKQTMKLVNALLTLFLLIWAPFTMAAKPAVPLSLKMAWTAPVTKGAYNTFTIRAFSAVSADKVTLTLKLPQNVDLTDGDLVTELSLRRGVPYEREFKVYINENALGTISGVLSMGQPGAAYFSSMSELIIDTVNTSTLKPRNLPEKKYRQIIRDGVKLREYPLD